MALADINKFVCVRDFEEHAQKILPKTSLDYYKSGAGEQLTLSQNKIAYNRLRIRPRFLIDVSKRDLSTTVQGYKIPMPIGVAPTAMQRLAHPDGEIANVKACEALGAVYCLSTLATTSIEDVAAAAPNCIKWFQLYIYKDRNVTRNLLSRAERAGFKAVVLTVDAPIFGVRRTDVRNKFKLPPHLRLANFDFTDERNKLDTEEGGSGLQTYVNKLFDASITWEDVKWLKSLTNLPIILKGVLTVEDAILARDNGFTGVWISNHGARQLDGVPTPIEVLPEISKAVGNDVELYVDGGVNEGIDVFKALALGARMCFIGRPALWGLTTNGEEGVKSVLKIMKLELDQTFCLAGCKSIADVKPEMVVHESYYESKY